MRCVRLKIPSIAITFLFLLANAGCLPSATNSQIASSSVVSLSNGKTSQILTPKTKKKSNAPLVCIPKKVRLDDTLTLTMNAPHGGYLEIITPKKRYLFLSELDGDNLVEDGKKAGVAPLFAASDFAELTELKINVAEATTADYDKSLINGRYPLSKVFIEPGKYKFLLSLDSFEQDDPIIEGQCEIELVK